MISLTSRHHPFRVLAVLAVPALLAAGCGGSPSNGSQANQNPDVQALKWTQCMQQHGVRAKATSNGHGGSVGVPAPGQPGGPSQQQLQAAQQACKQYQPNGGQGNSGPPSAQQMDQMEKFAQCLRQHGVTAKVQGNGIEEQPGPAGPDQQAQAENTCRKQTGYNH
jgi:hypothetical protein